VLGDHVALHLLQLRELSCADESLIDEAIAESGLCAGRLQRLGQLGGADHLQLHRQSAKQRDGFLVAHVRRGIGSSPAGA